MNTTRDILKLSQITYNNFKISLVVFMPNITTNNAITCTNNKLFLIVSRIFLSILIALAYIYQSQKYKRGTLVHVLF